MKKTLLSLCLLTASNVMPAGVQFTNYLNQEQAKKELVFTDGVSFDQVEEETRKEHPHMPEVILVDKYLNLGDFTNKIPAPFYCQPPTNVTTSVLKNENPITTVALKEDNNRELQPLFKTQTLKTFKSPILANSEFKQLNSHGAKYLLLHEAGHAKYPYLIQSINIGSIGTFLAIGYYWKKIINAQPYKNKFCKYTSKFIAARIASECFVRFAMNLEERRADSYANHYSKKEDIEGGIKWLKEIKPHYEEYWKTYKLSKVIPFSLGQYIFDPLHPSTDSRIRKLTKAANSKE